MRVSDVTFAKQAESDANTDTICLKAIKIECVFRTGCCKYSAGKREPSENIEHSEPSS